MTAAKAIAATGTSTPSNMATNLVSPTSPPSTVEVVVVVDDVVVLVVVSVVVVGVVDSAVDGGSVDDVSEVMSAVGVGTVSGASVSVDPVLFVAMSVNARVCEVRGRKALLS